MFTGLVQGMGKMLAVEPRGQETRLRMLPLFEMRGIALGESIAVNGACLTVETSEGGAFTAYASAETLSKTSLGRLRPNHLVNLERALAFGDRLGGHLVSGHVDCLAEVVSIASAGESRVYTLRFPAEFGVQVIPKGSVALDGISLTVNECGEDFLRVNVIPATQRETTIAEWTPGRAVNMETDLIGKYVQRMLGAWGGKTSAPAEPSKSPISEEFLRRHGF
jgi:riboflavin synthase